MHIGSFQFAPPLLPTLGYLVMLMFLIFLGVWQLDRAEQKHTELAQRAAAIEAPVVSLNDKPAESGLAAFEFRRARATGVYDTQRQFLLDNQVEDSEVGYRWLVPLRIEGQDQAVLVDRGFLPVGDDRRQLPAVVIEQPEQTVTGQIAPRPTVAMQLGEPSDNPGEWPRRVQYLDYEYFDSQTPYPLLAGQLLIEGSLDLAPRIERTGREAWRYGPERHEGYAFQWFSMAAALTVIWLVVNTKRRQPRNKS